MANTLLDDLISHWSFDNDATDLHGTHDMTLVNTPSVTIGAPAAWTYSLDTDRASSEYAYTADHADWDALAGTGEWSVGFWFNADALSLTRYLFNAFSGSAGTRSFVVYLSGTTLRLRVEVSDVAKDATWGTALSTGTWYCVQVWRSGDNEYISVNNATAVSTALGASASIDAWVQPLTWAARAGGPQDYFDGKANGLSVWGADIGATNRTEFYAAGAGLAYADWDATAGGSDATAAIVTGRIAVPHLVRTGRAHNLTR